MKRTIRLMQLCFVITILIAVIGFILTFRHVNVYFPLPEGVHSVQELELYWEEGHMQTEITGMDGDTVCLRMTAEKPGTQGLCLCDRNGNVLKLLVFKTTKHGLIYDTGYGAFSGCYALIAALCFFCISFALILFHSFFSRAGTRIYSYSSILSFGMALFLSIFGISLVFEFSMHLADPNTYGIYRIYSALSGAAWRFMILTSPLILAFAISLIVSNVRLLRNEGKAFHNLLGGMAGTLMIAGLILCFVLVMRPFYGSVTELRIRDTVDSVACTVYVYFECILFSSAVNGLRAAKHKPPYDRDYILILGCGFRQDGTLTPLLKGRADAALQFRKEQLENTGKAAVFVPSGGQGSDEPMPEAEAISRYLISQGVEENAILKETRSTTTLENMRFSRELIEQEHPDAKVAFATTNYHVFRSGLWAQLAGLEAEGIGGRTKWWFWPNAFMRECVGLLQKRLKQEVIWLAALVCLLGGVSYLIPR